LALTWASFKITMPILMAIKKKLLGDNYSLSCLVHVDTSETRSQMSVINLIPKDLSLKHIWQLSAWHSVQDILLVLTSNITCLHEMKNTRSWQGILALKKDQLYFLMMANRSRSLAIML
jgi:hypothetical protein